MALRARSLFLYGLEVTTLNSSIDFQIVSLGVQKSATVQLGYYSLTGLMAAIKAAMEAADPAHTYTVTADRTYSSGTQNRITIATSGAFLSLLFATGTRAASSTASLIGFTAVNQTGATTYTGSSSSGTVLESTLNGYNYLSTDHVRKVFGSLNISTTGLKEAIVFQTQLFFQVQFKFEPASTVSSNWTPLMTWMINQKPLEFTPEVSTPSAFYECTLEKTSSDGKGLSYQFKEQIPQFPNFYDTGLMTFRKKVT